MRIQFEGKRRIISTGTADLTLARIKAKELIANVIDGKPDETRVAKMARSKIPKIGAVIDPFINGDQHVREQTARDYVLGLLKICREARGWDEETARKKKIDVLTDSLVRDF